MTAADLDAHHRLGISREALERAQVRRVEDREARERLTSRHTGDLSGILYPYLHPKTGFVRTYRLRRDHPERENGKPKDKYLFAYGDRSCLYFPPRCEALLSDTAVEVLIVEAEKSVLSVTCAAARVGRSVLTIGTGGCWGWRGIVGKTTDESGARVDEKGPLPDLDLVAWTGRTAIVAFDSNAAANKKVQDARRALAHELSRRGAVVRVIDIPADTDVNGPDDYIGLRGAEAFFALVDAPSTPADEVVMRGGDLTAIVDRAETALLSAPIYQRGGLLTRSIKLDLAIGDGTREVHREAGSTVLLDVREAWLVEQMGRVLRWYRENAKGTRTLCDPQSLYARTLLGRGEWRFPVLRGVVTAPTLARDGRIIAAPGFDAESGLLVDVPRGAFPPVPEHPTKDDAARALARLAEPLRGFPFVDDAARSVALSALLTALVRVSLNHSPLHGFDAPTAGTGKSLLAEMVGLLATGVRPPALSQGKNDEEDEKRLSTVLFAGDPVIHIDNCERPISGDFLCSMLTQETVQARILGLSERRVLPSTALVLASGNNLTFAGDTSRRAVVCRLDAKVERPDARTFDFDCHAEVLASRRELVAAGLTVLRAYDVAGRPERLKPMGGFDEWVWIRGALVWLGHADPELTRQGVLDNDPKKDELLVVMDLWEEAFGPTLMEVGDVVRIADWAFDSQKPQPSNRDAVAALRDKLIEVACRGAWSGKSVGWWLRRNKDRVLAGRSFRCDQQGGRQQWRLAGAGSSRQQDLDNAVSLVSTVSSQAEPECNF